MPFVTVTTPEVIESVSRPVVFDIIKQVQEITKIDKNTKIIFPGDTGKMQQAGSDINNTSKQALLTTGKYIYIEVEEDFDPNKIATTAYFQNEQIPIFIDKDVAVSMSPLYATTAVTVKFKYQNSSRTEVTRWRDDIRMRLSGMRDINLHDITYHYLVPAPYIKLLKEIYNNKQRLIPTEQLFEDYVNSNITTRAKIISDMAGKDVRLSVSETQCRIIGMYSFDSMPEKPIRDDDSGMWSIEFGYKFTYECPNMVAMRYPVMIYNQLLPQEYIGFLNTEYDDSNVNKSYSNSIGALSNFESPNVTATAKNFKAEYALPTFDDFTPPNKPTSTVGAFVALCQVDETDKKTLLNLNDLGDIVLDPAIINFLIDGEYQYLNKLYQSMITVSLYENYTLKDSNTLIIDSNLNISSVVPLDLTKFYHVRLSIVTDLSLVSQTFFTRLLGYPAAMYALVVAVNSGLRNNPSLRELANMTSVTPADFSILFSKMTGLRYAPKNNILTGNIVSTVKTPVATIYGSNSSYSMGSKNSAIANMNDPLASIRGVGLQQFINSSVNMNTVEVGYIVSLKK